MRVFGLLAWHGWEYTRTASPVSCGLKAGPASLGDSSGQRLRRSKPHCFARDGATMGRSLASPASAAEPYRWAANEQTTVQP